MSTTKMPKGSKRIAKETDEGHKAELEAKRQRQAEKFTSYFHKVERVEPPRLLVVEENRDTSVNNTNSNMARRFKPFQLKEGMRLAPIHVRRVLTRAECDSLLKMVVELRNEEGDNEEVLWVSKISYLEEFFRLNYSYHAWKIF